MYQYSTARTNLISAAGTRFGLEGGRSRTRRHSCRMLQLSDEHHG